MDLELSPSQKQLQDQARAFAERELNRQLAERDRSCQFPAELWKKCAQYGILGLAIPEAYGGTGLDIISTVAIMEGLGRGCKDNGLLFGMNAQMWSVQHPIVTFGNDTQKAKFLPPLVNGDWIAAHAMTEPDAGSDAYGLRTTARRVKGGYELTGTKTLVTNAPIADLALVFATSDPKKGMWGISGFLVEAGSSGFSQGPNIEKMGLRTSPLGEIVLEECFVPETNRLGVEGLGAQLFNSSMAWERACILATHLGAMERHLETSIEHAKARQQFGQPIANFQAVSHRIVDMKVRLEASRLLLYKVACLKNKDKQSGLESALAKLYLSEAFLASSLDAVRLRGGYGYTTEYGIERDLRDAVGGVLYSGTSELQRNIIAGHLGLGRR